MYLACRAWASGLRPHVRAKVNVLINLGGDWLTVSEPELYTCTLTDEYIRERVK
jgi:hypothetical protein